MEKQKQGKMENKGKQNKYKDSKLGNRGQYRMKVNKQNVLPRMPDTEMQNTEEKKRVQSKNII